MRLGAWGCSSFYRVFILDRRVRADPPPGHICQDAKLSLWTTPEDRKVSSRFLRHQLPTCVPAVGRLAYLSLCPCPPCIFLYFLFRQRVGSRIYICLSISLCICSCVSAFRRETLHEGEAEVKTFRLPGFLSLQFPFLRWGELDRHSFCCQGMRKRRSLLSSLFLALFCLRED